MQYATQAKSIKERYAPPKLPMSKWKEYNEEEWYERYQMWEHFPEFCERYLSIVLKRGGAPVPFALNRPQKVVLDIIIDALMAGKVSKFIILKARQEGISTLIEAILFWLVITSKGYKAGVITHEDGATQNLYEMFLTYTNYYSSPYKPIPDTKNKNMLKFSGIKSSVQLFTAGSPNSTRSFTKQAIHISELAFWKSDKIGMTSVMQALSKDAFVFNESTANGVGNAFHSLWIDAITGKNNYTPIFLAWFDNPEYTLAPFEYDDALQYSAEERQIATSFSLTENQMRWRRMMISDYCGGDVNVFHQEYPCSWEEAFLSTGSPYFSQEALSRIYNNLAANPPNAERGILSFTEDSDVVFELDSDVIAGGYKPECQAVEIYAHPILNDRTERRYCIGIDTSEGIDKSLIAGTNKKSTSNDTDWSVITVRDRVTGKQVAISRNKLAADKLALLGVQLMIYYRVEIIVKDGQWHYSYPLEVIEKNGIGLSTVKESIRLCNLYKIPLDRLYSQEQYPSSITIQTKEHDIGWRTTGGQGDSTKKALLLRSQIMIRDSYVDNAFIDKTGFQSLIVVKEHQNFTSYSNGKIGAKQGSHDDCVMSDALCLEGDKRDDPPTVVEKQIFSERLSRGYRFKSANRNPHTSGYWSGQKLPKLKKN